MVSMTQQELIAKVLPEAIKRANKTKAKLLQYQRDYYINNRPKVRAKQSQYDRRAYRRKRNYGLSEEDYEKLVLEADGKCLICVKEKKLVIDHNYKTGKVRGLICSSCNKGLGHFFEDIEAIEKAAQYIRTRNQ